MGQVNTRQRQRVFLHTPPGSGYGDSLFLSRKLCILAALTFILAVAGCARQYTPMPLEQLNVIARAKTQTQNGITVSAAVLNPEESLHVFGVNLAKTGVQPVWLTIRNDTDEDQIFLPMSVDPDYFSPHEVWWKTRYEKDREASKRMAIRFRELLIPHIIEPHSKVSGFVLTPLHSGSIRMINVDILGLSKTTTFNYFLAIPGFLADHHLVKFDSLYQAGDFKTCTTLDELKAQIETLPCCVTNEKGDTNGDPLNIVIVSEPDAAWRSMVRRGWDETEPITGASAMKTVNAFMAGKEYRTSPISALYVFGRSQDIALQKARKTIHERNHLRLWLAPIKYKDNHIWVGTVSRDIGVKMTSRTWSLTTHEIDGNVDEARAYLTQDAAYSQNLKALAFTGGVGKVPMDAPRLNLTDSPWYTDGDRAILFLTNEETPLADIKFLDW
ncbi:MAG: LssY C-terminal domain-containing protein [Pseudodesulfovibrio sp.]|nr:LssY C-terminal domain-containing protein [Pseudodesulfovibrio sp.]